MLLKTHRAGLHYGLVPRAGIKGFEVKRYRRLQLSWLAVFGARNSGTQATLKSLNIGFISDDAIIDAAID